MAKKAMEVRIVIYEGSEDMDVVEIVDNIKDLIKSNKEVEIVKGCIRLAYEHFYKKLIEQT